MNTVISKLLVYIYNGYNQDVYYDLSIFILSHLDEIRDMTLTAFSSRCHTSATTVKKFCQLLGYRDFNVFKQYLYSTMKIRRKQIDERYGVFDEKKAIEQMQLNGGAESFNKNVERVVDDLYKADVIFIMGANYPLFLCFNFIEDMLVFNKKCFIQNVDNRMSSYFNEKNTYCLLITITGRYFMLNKVKSQLLEDTYAKYGVISQNSQILHYLPNVDAFLKLPGDRDDEALNIVLLDLLMIIKFAYYQKYVLKS